MAPDPDDPSKNESTFMDDDDPPRTSDEEEKSESESSEPALQGDLVGPRELGLEEDIGADLDWDLYTKSGAKRPEKSFMVGELGKFWRRFGAKFWDLDGGQLRWLWWLGRKEHGGGEEI